MKGHTLESMLTTDLYNYMLAHPSILCEKGSCCSDLHHLVTRLSALSTIWEEKKTLANLSEVCPFIFCWIM